MEGRPLPGLEAAGPRFADVVEEGGQRTFRYMKAIPTASMCLKCHGAELAPEVSGALAELYPDDEAVGYSSGELRGAFSVVWPAP